jgi:hypothetical protein
MHELGYKPKAPRLTIKLAMQMIGCNRSYLELYYERVERGLNIDINQKLIDEHEDANKRLKEWIDAQINKE